LTQIPLELFFYRRQRINRVLKNLNNEIPGLVTTVSSYDDSEVNEYFPPKYIKKAENTVIPFKWLFVFENDFRDLCRNVLGKKFNLDDEEIFEKLKIKEDEAGTIKKRIKGEEASLSSSREKSDVLDFFTLPELKNLVVNNWDFFEEDFPRGKKFVDSIINQLNRHRISVAHFFELDELDIRDLENRLLRFYRTFE